MKRFRTDSLRENEPIGDQEPTGTPTGFLNVFSRFLQSFLKRRIFAFRRRKPGYRKLKESFIDDGSFDNGEDMSSCGSYDEEEDAIFCAVCERTFDTRRMLNDHRLQKRHYYCTTCEDIFSNFMQLQRHSFEHDHDSDEEEVYCSWDNSSDYQQLNNEVESLL